VPGEFDAIAGADQLDKVIVIDQSPIGRTPRSNPATYVKVWDDIRALFTMLPEAKQAMGDIVRFIGEHARPEVETAAPPVSVPSVPA
jgi:excinuclease ABC subunit A